MQTPSESELHNLRDTLARLEEKIEKINCTVNPPFWIKLLRYIWRNLFTIILIIILVIISYKAYDAYLDLINRIEEVKSIPANVIDSGKDSVETLIDKIKFW